MRKTSALVCFVFVLAAIAVIAWLSCRPRVQHHTLTACRSNIQLLGIELSIYAQDHDGVLPSAGPSRRRRPNWVESLYAQCTTKDQKDALARRLKCPLDTTRSATSYVLNPRLAGHSLDKIAADRKSQIPLLFEDRPRHRGKRLVLYADGHTELVKDFEAE